MLFRWLVGLIFTAFVTFFVTSCGQNPEKQRVILDSKEDVRVQFSEKPYISASGSWFQISKNDDSMVFGVPGEPLSFSVIYRPKTKELSISGRSGNEVFSTTDFSDQMKPLQDIWTQVQADHPGKSEWEQISLSPFNEDETLSVQCEEQRSGELRSVFQRPKDLSVTYKYASAIDLFKHYPEALYVMDFAISSERGDIFFTETPQKGSLYENYFQSDKVRNFLQSQCRASLYNSMDSFFGSSVYGGSTEGNNKVFQIAVAEINDQRLRRAGFQSLSELLDVDAQFFTVEEEKQPADILKPLLASPMSAGVWTSELNGETGEYESKKSFDNSKIQLDIRMELQEFEIGNRQSESSCQYHLNAALEDSYFHTRRGPQYSQSFTLDLKVKKWELLEPSQCSNPMQSVVVGDSLKAYIAVGHNGGSLKLHIVDPSREKELISGVQFLKR